MKKLILTLLAVFTLAGLVGCGPQKLAVAPDEIPADEAYFCTSPESDNGNAWKSGSVVCYDTRVYSLTAEVLGDISSNQTVSGSGSGYSVNGTGSSSMRIWTDGKGVLPVKILEIFPDDPVNDEWLDISKPYILKTSDLGALGIPVGAVVEFVCNHDVEVLSPVFPNQTLSTDRLTNELDNCRMKTKNIAFPVPVTIPAE